MPGLPQKTCIARFNQLLNSAALRCKDPVYQVVDDDERRRPVVGFGEILGDEVAARNSGRPGHRLVDAREEKARRVRSRRNQRC